MIIWLASWPKSGNTWVRAFLISYLYLNLDKETFDFKHFEIINKFPQLKHLRDIGINPKSFEDVAKSWIEMQKHINLNNKINFFKTHQAFGSFKNIPFTDQQNTLGAIYLVRDPRDVLVSYSNHIDGSINEALEHLLIKDTKGYIAEKVSKVSGEIRGSWSQHYNSWKNFKVGEIIFVKYEDLLNDSFNTFTRIIEFISKLYKKKSLLLEVDGERIKKCIELTNFASLAKLEKNSEFTEKVRSDVLFFNKGKTKQWINKIDKEILFKIENKFNSEMKELNYI